MHRLVDTFVSKHDLKLMCKAFNAFRDQTQRFGILILRNAIQAHKFKTTNI